MRLFVCFLSANCLLLLKKVIKRTVDVAKERERKRVCIGIHYIILALILTYQNIKKYMHYKNKNKTQAHLGYVKKNP